MTSSGGRLERCPSDNEEYVEEQEKHRSTEGQVWLLRCTTSTVRTEIGYTLGMSPDRQSTERH